MKVVIGITGGIASGKSNVCNIIENMGYEVIDCDNISYRLSKKGGPIYNVILEKFGEEYFLENGELDRKKLGNLIFNNLDEKKILDEITHPLIHEEVKKKLDSFDNGIIFLEAPLLYEAHMEHICDKVICVFLSKKFQVERLMAREGIDEDYALAKIHSQMDLYMKKTLADYVIDTRGTFDETKAQVEKVIEEIKGV